MKLDKLVELAQEYKRLEALWRKTANACAGIDDPNNYLVKLEASLDQDLTSIHQEAVDLLKDMGHNLSRRESREWLLGTYNINTNRHMKNLIWGGDKDD